MTDTTNESTLGTSATLPATIDAAGYDALTFTDIVNILDVGEVAKLYNTILHQTVGLRYPEKLKGNYDIPEVTMTLGRVIADAGQVLIQTALSVDVSYAFEITFGSANSANFTAKIMKAGTGPIAADGVETTLVTLAIDPESLLER